LRFDGLHSVETSVVDVHALVERVHSQPTRLTPDLDGGTERVGGAIDHTDGAKFIGNVDEVVITESVLPSITTT
jgi:hypothetical protein